MYNKKVLNNTKNSVIKIVSILTISQLLSKVFNNNVVLFNKRIILRIMANTMGFVVFELLTRSLIDKFKSPNKIINIFIKTFIKFGTVIITLQSILTSSHDYDPDYPLFFIKSTLVILFASSIFRAFIKPLLPKKLQIPISDDIGRTISSLIALQIINKNIFTPETLTRNFFKVVGVILFYKFIKPKL